MKNGITSFVMHAVLPHLGDVSCLVVHVFATLHTSLTRHRNSFLSSRLVFNIVVFICTKMLGSKNYHSPELESELEDEFLRPSMGLG